MPASATRLRVRVAPGAARPGIDGKHGDGWKLRVSEPPERGRANAAATTLLANALDVAPERVRLVAGHGSRDKTIEVEGLTQRELGRRLEHGSDR